MLSAWRAGGAPYEPLRATVSRDKTQCETLLGFGSGGWKGRVLRRVGAHALPARPAKQFAGGSYQRLLRPLRA